MTSRFKLRPDVELMMMRTYTFGTQNIYHTLTHNLENNKLTRLMTAQGSVRGKNFKLTDYINQENGLDGA